MLYVCNIPNGAADPALRGTKKFLVDLPVFYFCCQVNKFLRTLTLKLPAKVVGSYLNPITLILNAIS